jgi:LysM repeat protein
VVRTPQVRYYKVRPGDTLTEIAARNNTTVTKICQLNGIKPTTVLQLGRSLRVK